MPLLFILMMCLLGIGIAMFRRSPQAFLDGPSEDMPTRLLRWAAGLLSAERAEWGQAMLGELGHLDGQIRRLRFTLGCVIAVLLLPPWGRLPPPAPRPGTDPAVRVQLPGQQALPASPVVQVPSASRAGSSRRRYSRVPVASMTSSTSSGGNVLVSTPIEIRSGSHPPGGSPSAPS